MLPSSNLFSIALAGAALYPVVAASEVACRIVTFHVDATGDNFDISQDFDPNNATAIDAFVHQALTTGQVASNGQAPVTAALSISGQYCAPVGEEYSESIQILVHGNTCDRTIWDGLGQTPLQARGYSYQRALATHGYASLALDMPGHGQSTAADPNSIVQMPLEAAVITNIAASLRSKQNPLGAAFSKVVFVGHSYGSVTGIAAARLDPGFADALIMTGWSSRLPLPSPLLELNLRSAALLFPRFENLPLGYLAASNATGYSDIFFGGSFEPEIPQQSFRLQSIITCGEGGSIVAGLAPAVNYAGKVFVITGDKDVLFCNPANGPCESQLSGSSALVPSAAGFQTHLIPNTGHNFMLHNSKADSFHQIAKFLQTL